MKLTKSYKLLFKSIITAIVIIAIQSCTVFKQYPYTDEYVYATPVSYEKAKNQDVYKISLVFSYGSGIKILTDDLNMSRRKFHIRVTKNHHDKIISYREITKNK